MQEKGITSNADLRNWCWNGT